MTLPAGDITEVLVRWSRGDQDALDELIPLVYAELHRRAAKQLRHERRGHAMGATSLVHLAYFRIRDFPRIPWKNRAQFFCAATKVMWRVLVDYARGHGAIKRGGGEQPLPIGEDASLGEVNPADRRAPLDKVVDLDIALKRLKIFDERDYMVFMLRSVWEFTARETADLLGISTATVERNHRLALAFLKRELGGGEGLRA